MDDRALRAELEMLHPESFGWARRCCADDPQQAEDVLHTAYLKVLDGRARYDGRASFKTWLFAVIRMTAAGVRRWRWLRVVGVDRPARPREAAAADESLEQAETSQWFRQALASLPRRQREVLQLVFYHDLSLPEAAEVMGVALGSARTHYERGKRALREWLEQAGVEDEIGRYRNPEAV